MLSFKWTLKSNIAVTKIRFKLIQGLGDVNKNITDRPTRGP